MKVSGKSTLTDSLVVAASVIGQEVDGDAGMIDTCDDELRRRRTIKSTSMSLYYTMTNEALKSFKGERDGNIYVINLIDSPGHVDFSFKIELKMGVEK
uniref:Elongation factor 2 n=1 Tax=Tanacetum cinerariifolium TaxID=118510 RepID=A0A6L2LAK4_TANCI|nr:elongation factor 2 [Tanacetum cinerariifolium]